MVPAESPIASPSGLLLLPLLIALGILVAVLAALLALHLLPKRLDSRSRACLGVESKVLDSLPVHVYDEDHEFLQHECCVCLSALEDGAVVRVMPLCRHVFHRRCVDPWLVSHLSCPFCRAEVTLSDAFVVKVMFVDDREI